MTVYTNQPARAAGRGLFRVLADLPLSIKLVAAFVIVVALAVGLLVYFSNAITTAELKTDLGLNLRTRAEDSATEIGHLLNDEIVNGLRTLALNRLFQDLVVVANTSYIGSADDILGQIEAIDRQWVAAPDSDTLIQSRLTNEIASELQEYSNTFTNHLELFMTDRYGALIGASNRTSDYYQADEAWWQAAWNNGQGGVFIGQPEFDDSTGTTALIVAVPVYGHSTAGIDSSDVVGVLRTTVDFAELAGVVSAFKLGETGFADLYFADGRVFQPESGDIQNGDLQFLTQLQTQLGEGGIEGVYEGRPSLLSIVPLGAVTDKAHVQNLGWTLVVQQDIAEALQPVTTTIQSILGIGLLVLAGAAMVAVVMARLIANPITRLTQVAQQFASGDLTQRATVSGQDEIGLLASGFNSMAEQLEEQFNTLEERVSERTRDLQTVSEVSARVSTILEPERLLRDVADLTKERFRLYHSHIYLVDDTGEKLTLTAGAGYVGRQMVSEKRTIAMENPQSIVAGAARSRRGIIVNDVRESPTFLPHPLLPDTRAELAVPLVARGQLLGVLDVQSNEVGYFDENNLAVIELMASQIAAAISNARLYESAERTSRHERALGAIERKIQGALSMDEILQTGVRELGKALRVPYTAIELQMPNESVNGDKAADERN